MLVEAIVRNSFAKADRINTQFTHLLFYYERKPQRNAVQRFAQELMQN
jgi:hypothetical protein